MVDDKMYENNVIMDDEEYFEDDFDLLGDDYDEEYDEYYSDDEFEWNFPTPTGIPPSAEELADWAAFNYELSLTFIPDWERSRDWM